MARGEGGGSCRGRLLRWRQEGGGPSSGCSPFPGRRRLSQHIEHDEAPDARRAHRYTGWFSGARGLGFHVPSRRGAAVWLLLRPFLGGRGGSPSKADWTWPSHEKPTKRHDAFKVLQAVNFMVWLARRGGGAENPACRKTHKQGLKQALHGMFQHGGGSQHPKKFGNFDFSAVEAQRGGLGTSPSLGKDTPRQFSGSTAPKLKKIQNHVFQHCDHPQRSCITCDHGIARYGLLRPLDCEQCNPTVCHVCQCYATTSRDTTGTVIGPSSRCLAEGNRISCFKLAAIYHRNSTGVHKVKSH